MIAEEEVFSEQHKWAGSRLKDRSILAQSSHQSTQAVEFYRYEPQNIGLDNTTSVGEETGEFTPQIRFLIQGSIAPGWFVIQPLELNLEIDDDDSLIVSDEIFYEYGAGDTFAAAKQDYINNLIDYWQFLAGAQDESSETEMLFDFLQKYLIRK